MAWTEVKNAKLKELFEEGLEIYAIAAALGATHSSVRARLTKSGDLDAARALRVWQGDRRTKNEVCSDLAVLFVSAVTERTKHMCAFHAIWYWTTFDGAMSLKLPWSEEAWGGRAEAKPVRHEHVIPISYTITKLLRLSEAHRTAEAVRKLLDNEAVGCIVSQAEDQRLTGRGYCYWMPTKWSWNAEEVHDSVWARYAENKGNIAVNLPSNAEGTERRPLCKQSWQEYVQAREATSGDARPRGRG